MSRPTRSARTSAAAALCAGLSLAGSLSLAPSAAAAPAPAALSIYGSAVSLPAGGVLTLAGQLTSGGAPVVGKPVLLLARTGGTTVERTDRQLTTDATGRVKVSFHPRLSTAYRFAFAGDATTSAVRSTVKVALVTPGVVTTANRRTAAQGDPVTISGYLRPALTQVPVTLERRVGSGAWQVVLRRRTDAAARYAFAFRAPLEDNLSFRVGLPGTPSYRFSYGPAQPLVVAGPLSVGARGPRVAALQNRLKALRYDLGAVDGAFGGDTLHALTAFQKSQGLPRTGRYDVVTRERMAAPRAVTVRYPAAGRAVEVDLARQIMIMSEGGRVTRIVDVSTGNNQYYYSDGVRYLANTPLGRFRVYRKIDGVRVARLGELYRPSYFVQGWAIHGSPSVPTYPASHGCVRVTNATVDRIYSLLTIGTPVSIYAR